MLIINADDWGGARADTDVALSCYRAGSITSVTAMVFMDDSERAAELAGNAGIEVGFHLNLFEPFTGNCDNRLLREYHNSIISYLMRGQYYALMYNPALRNAFQYVYQAQVDEFMRLYGRPYTHIDGHHHKHLCTNILLDGIIPAGEKVRRNFFFWPDEKSVLNRTFRSFQDRWLAKKYRIVDYFFSISQGFQMNRMSHIMDLSRTAAVEVMVHPVRAHERDYLLSETHRMMLLDIDKGTYASI